MFDYQKLEGEIEEKRGRAKHIVDTAVAETREMTESERREYDTLYGEISATRGLIDQMKDQELDDLRKAISVETPKVETARNMAQAFRTLGYDNTGLNIEHRDWTTASGASATIAQEWHDMVLSVAFENSILRQLGADIFRTATTHNVPYLSAYGSGTAVIVNEMTAYTEDDPSISNLQIGAYKFVKRVDVSEEMLSDTSYDVAGLLAKAAGVAFGLAEDRYFVGPSGTGTSTPSGIFSHSATSSGAGASAVTAAELISFVYSLPRHYRTGAVMIMNDDMAGRIAALRTTASSVEGYFWTDPIGGEPAKLLGYPVYTSSYVPSAATASAKVIALTNPKYYVIGERGPLNVKRMQLNEYSDTFAMARRMDGHPLTASATVVFTTSTT